MRIGVLGNGHVGLVTCVSLAEMGHDVIGCDRDDAKMSLLKRGVVHFYEPGVDAALARVLEGGNLRFTSDPDAALREAEVVFICVGTPGGVDGRADLSAVQAAASDIARSCSGKVVVVQKSTVPIGTSELVHDVVSELNRDDLVVEVVSNPEFLREGRALHDALSPSRIVVGSRSAWAVDVMRELYRPLTSRGAAFVETDPHTAEVSKLASNAFLALKISFANALARVCEAADADVVTAADVMGMDPRIGRHFLNAGLGFGGFCLPKDVAAFDRLSSELGYDFPLLREVVRINDEALEVVIAKIDLALGGLRCRRVALLGLAFKPGTSDVRSAPALALAGRLRVAGASVVGYDPRASETASDAMSELEVAADPYVAATGAECVVVCTEWEEFRELDLARLASLMHRPILVDGRNFLDPWRAVAAGLEYIPMGRPSPALLGEVGLR